MIMLTHFFFFSPAVLILSSNMQLVCSCFCSVLPVLQALSLCINGISESAAVLPEHRRIHCVIWSASLDTGVDIDFLPEDLCLCVDDRRMKPTHFSTFFVVFEG